ncbi:hypothetical protein K458DRAFT_39763 [Lentithecium fluviatile CBS 122367]|uniref:Uncharacterized protein n=1 Tax=Lentithecium fluviatile CBS 122367 TaxID=1168545 RepID=A0A6G1IZA8_9PLEO|nr:hypothetical protein K458DRAFT_39763 [Lentithecium fluviatile CBS 122367]
MMRHSRSWTRSALPARRRPFHLAGAQSACEQLPGVPRVFEKATSIGDPCQGPREGTFTPAEITQLPHGQGAGARVRVRASWQRSPYHGPPGKSVAERRTGARRASEGWLGAENVASAAASQQCRRGADHLLARQLLSRTWHMQATRSRAVVMYREGSRGASARRAVNTKPAGASLPQIGE